MLPIALLLMSPKSYGHCRLLEDGATVPFIARYRKEATGLLDEVAVASIRDEYETQIEFVKRRKAITDSLQKRDLLDASLENKLLVMLNHSISSKTSIYPIVPRDEPEVP